VLAYLFWHTPRSDDGARYERGLAAFHRALAGAPPTGFVRSWTLRVDRPAWLPDGPAHYLDWYLVESFAALGELNDGAITGTRRAPHDDVAALARTGTAGLVAHVAGTTGIPDAPAMLLALVDKPAGQPYSTFRTDLTEAAATRPGTACWMRQMTLGPGPEFAVLADRDQMPPLPAPVTILDAAVVATA
jgi:hypothetical protein